MQVTLLIIIARTSMARGPGPSHCYYWIEAKTISSADVQDPRVQLITIEAADPVDPLKWTRWSFAFYSNFRRVPRPRTTESSALIFLLFERKAAFR